MPDVPFEPFSYATALIDETFQILVEMSAAVASEGASAHFTDEPPTINENLPYAEETRRIALLT